MGLSLGHLLVVLLIVLVVFGAGKLPAVMGDLGKGLRSFKSGLSGKETDDDPSNISDHAFHLDARLDKKSVQDTLKNKE